MDMQSDYWYSVVGSAQLEHHQLLSLVNVTHRCLYLWLVLHSLVLHVSVHGAVYLNVTC